MQKAAMSKVTRFMADIDRLIGRADGLVGVFWLQELKIY
jgi:hypothetical protein